MEVNGIAHRLTVRELMALDASECEGSATQRISATFHPYSPIDGKAALGVYTYVAVSFKVASPGSPSQRFLDLLCNAAEHSGLTPEYVTWLRSHPTCSNSGKQMPGPNFEERRRLVTASELSANVYYDGTTAGAWVALGGQVFDLNSHSVARVCGPREQMLRNMALHQDGTSFVLSILARAYPEEEVTAQLSKLSSRQREYVSAWASFLVANGCPRVGVLEGSKWECLVPQQSPVSVVPSVADR